ncbi:uncharacterized protein LOC126891046 [Diabrotica virgifera virgifera]|uniref:Endonuclease/exonuclease/phosphatase domain-containing protein n=1 Tax=Diabrotica virgifera virgifera TaxID=50390 RepID=A0ABM5L167_DIAVI|nr:uncharacterized protein LOC126891046 [Diabrotica virgifera virgifera]
MNNAGGMCTKLPNFRQAVLLSSYDIIVIIETWLTSKILDAELGLCDFNVFKHDRDTQTSSKTRGGGVLIAIHKRLRSMMVKPIDSSVEHVFAQVMCSTKKLIIGAVYFPPRSSGSLYEEHSTCMLDLADRFSDCEFCICGDYNLPEASWYNLNDGVTVECPQHYSANIICTCYNFLNMSQVNTLPNLNDTFLDLVFCTQRDAVVSISTILLNTSQHHSAYTILLPAANLNLFLKYDVFYHDFKKCNYQVLNEHLASIPWNEVLDVSDINCCIDNFYHVLYDAISMFVPVNRFKSLNFPVWFSRELIELVIQKKIAHRNFKASGNSYEEFSVLRERCKSLQAVCYKNYLENIQANLSSNPRSFWRHVNATCGSNTYPNVMSNEGGDVIAQCGEEIVNLFANYFSGTYNDSEYNLPNFELDYSVDIQTLEFSLTDVFEGIMSLKTTYSSGPDGSTDNT